MISIIKSFIRGIQEEKARLAAERAIEEIQALVKDHERVCKERTRILQELNMDNFIDYPHRMKRDKKEE